MYQLQPWMAQFGQQGGIQPSSASPLSAALGGQGAGGPMSQFMGPHMAPPMGAAPMVGGGMMPPQAPHPGMQQFVGQVGQNGQQGSGLLGLLQGLHGLMPQTSPAAQQVQAAYPQGAVGRANPGTQFNPQALQQYWNGQNAQQPVTPQNWHQFNGQ